MPASAPRGRQSWPRAALTAARQQVVPSSYLALICAAAACTKTTLTTVLQWQPEGGNCGILWHRSGNRGGRHRQRQPHH